MRIGIIKYGLGNIGSVYQALKNINSDPVIIEDPFEIKNVDKLILPGVGNFMKSKKILDKLGWTDEILDATLNNRKSILGICLGMQLLAEWGYEGSLEDDHAPQRGLGLIKGEVVNLKDLGCIERIPHVGWNTVSWLCNAEILNGIPSETDFYFVHSFAFVPQDLTQIKATVNYSIPVTAIINKDNIWGTQFHPEKSSKAGLKILQNFADYI